MTAAYQHVTFSLNVTVVSAHLVALENSAVRSDAEYAASMVWRAFESTLKAMSTIRRTREASAANNEPFNLAR